MGKQAITIVTGASAGIGEEFARQLAKRGDRLLLVARRGDRLEVLAAELAEEYGSHVEVESVDLADENAIVAFVDSLRAARRPVELLVNNAGFGLRGPFLDLSIEQQLAMVDLNIKAVMRLCHGLRPLYRQGSAIINVASMAAFQSGPYMATYYATKAFVLSFSEALHEEFKEEGVAVQALCPGPTDSDFGDVAGLEDLTIWKYGRMSARKVVKASLNNEDEAIVVPGISNRLLGHANKVIPRFVSRRIAALVQK